MNELTVKNTNNGNKNVLSIAPNTDNFNINTGNSSLDTISKNIASAYEIGENMAYITAVNLAYVKENKNVLNGTSYKNVEQYAKEMFGIGKSQCYNYCNSARFVTIGVPTLDENNNGILLEYNPFENDDITALTISVLSDSDNFRFNISKLAELSKYTDTEIKMLIDSDTIDSTMSDKEFIKACKSIRAIETSADDSNTEDSNTEDSNTEDSNTEDSNKVTYTLTSDIDRLNAILDIVKGIENESYKAVIKKAVNKCQTGTTNE